ncbi:hypothetical protein [Legionella sainthelensi]|uniref:hypothetical protein n=1 Tax=Legionella sainthelensi TaxID=28087 RepID=UPI000E20126D|nr:hypothetical protein [Legionella sainthelensi]
MAEEYLEQFLESLKKCQHKNFYLKLDANFLYLIPYPKRKEYIRRIEPLLAENGVSFDSFLTYGNNYRKLRQYALFFSILTHSKINQERGDSVPHVGEKSDSSELMLVIGNDSNEAESSISSC